MSLLSKNIAEVKVIMNKETSQDDETVVHQFHRSLKSKAYSILPATIHRCRKSLGWMLHGSAFCHTSISIAACFKSLNQTWHFIFPVYLTSCMWLALFPGLSGGMGLVYDQNSHNSPPIFIHRQQPKDWRWWQQGNEATLSGSTYMYLKEFQGLVNGPVPPWAGGRVVAFQLLIFLVAHIGMASAGR